MTVAVLRFTGGVAEGDAVWDGPWPPPDEFLGVRGRTTGKVAITTREILAEKGSSLEQMREFGEVTIYRLASHSTLPPDVAESGVIRCGAYEPEGE